ncbi:family protein [Lichtheimia corymbifera JMRC:FSU:9682]|uniref:Family protein n=1 Tax=Lichtheimia corymbifera JMRC:FSU:9682 TaxID=1263082 RepID=A0A068S1A6_9FUNG|nr:family protein [Lichtheimia corymbifera JMRC:FSU:9682]
MSDKQPIAIVGITGNQAGATAKHLLENGARVRGIARDPSKAVEWVNSQAELVTGSMDDYDSLVQAFTGVRSVYFATPFIVDDAEIQMGKNVVDAAKQAGVSHLVFSSVCIVEQCRMVPHWNTKYEIEQYIRASGIPFTMVRPALFMDNFTSTGLFPSKGDKMFGMLNPDRKQQLISVNDIGYVVSTIMLNPEEYLGKTIELASDYLCGNEMAQIRSKLLNGTDGTEGTYTVIPFTEHHIKAMVDFMQTHDYVADIPKLKKEFPKLRTWEEFVKEEIVEK